MPSHVTGPGLGDRAPRALLAAQARLVTPHDFAGSRSPRRGTNLLMR